MIARVLLTSALTVMLAISIGCKKQEQPAQPAPTGGANEQTASAASAPTVEQATPGKPAVVPAAPAVRSDVPDKAAQPADSAAAAPAAQGKVAANFGKIKQGMTIQQATALLGEPTTTSSFDNGAATHYVWEENGQTYYVQFQDGKAAIIVRGSDDEQAAAAKDLRAKFTGVKSGMTTEQVIKIMGDFDSSMASGDNSETYIWVDSQANYMVRFVDGKVDYTASAVNR